MNDYEIIEKALLGDAIELNEGQALVVSEIKNQYKRTGNISAAMGYMSDAEVYKCEDSGEEKMLSEWLDDNIEADMEDGYDDVGISYSEFCIQRGMAESHKIEIAIKNNLDS